MSAITCLDLAGRPNDAGGLNNVATVVAELVEETNLSAAALVDQADVYPLSCLRRLGWLFEHVGSEIDIQLLAETIAQQEPQRRRAVTLLDPTGPPRGRSNPRWGVVENTEVEPDL